MAQGPRRARSRPRSGRGGPRPRAGRVSRAGRWPDGPPSPKVGHQARGCARLAGRRRPGPGQAATRRGDLCRAIAQHPPFPPSRQAQPRALTGAPAPGTGALTELRAHALHKARAGRGPGRAAAGEDRDHARAVSPSSPSEGGEPAGLAGVADGVPRAALAWHKRRRAPPVAASPARAQGTRTVAGQGAALAGLGGGAKRSAAGDGVSRPPGSKRSAQRRRAVAAAKASGIEARRGKTPQAA